MPALLASLERCSQPLQRFTLPLHPIHTHQHICNMPNGNNSSSGNTGGGYNITSQGTNSQVSLFYLPLGGNW